MELVKRLSTVPLFEGLPQKQYAALADISECFSYEKEQKIFSEGDEPSLALNMMAVLSWRLHKFSNLIEDLSLKEVSGRLAAYLIHLSTIEGNDTGRIDPDRGFPHLHTGSCRS